MITLLKSKNYKKSVVALGKKDKVLVSKQEGLLTKDIFNPKLHTRKLQGFGRDKVFSFRITRAYRGIFRLEGESVILFAIGHRKDIYQSLD